MDTVTPGTIELIDVAEGGVTARVWLEPEHPMFAGHFPGFPIMPGVYLVDFVHRAVKAALGNGFDVQLVEVTSCRFLKPAFPGDSLVAEVAMVRSGTDLRCSATVSTGQGTIAELRCRCIAEQSS